jgi:RimJ/RimL family protein N-acetyltransferase
MESLQTASVGSSQPVEIASASTSGTSEHRSGWPWDHGSVSNPFWPFFGLKITTERLELRYPNDDELVQVAELAAAGIHDPDVMPFYVPWTRAPSPELERQVLQYTWSRRASLTPEDWSLPFMVLEHSTPVGFQDLFAIHFPTTRAVETGSWLVRSAQGRGIGKEMRAAVLHLAFAGLDAVEAYSASFEDNPASQAVSRANGYEPNGTLIHAREGRPARNLKWLLTRERWLESRRDDIEIHGLEPCRVLLDPQTGAP